MSFADLVVTQAWERSGGRCECRRTSHGHGGRCNRSVSLYARGMETNTGWEAHHVTAVAAGGADSLGNCEILCQECHKGTGTYGG